MRIGVDAGAFVEHRAGVARYLSNMLRHMMEAAPDLEFVLYAPRRIEPQLPPGNWRVCIPGSSGRRMPGMWLRHTLPDMMAHDAIHAFWGQNTIMPSRLRRPCNRVLTVHDLTAVLFPQTMQVRRRLSSRRCFREAIDSADHIVAVSQATADLVRRYFGVSACVLHVIREGLESGFGRMPDEQASKLLSRDFGIHVGFLLSVGTIEPRKDYSLLVEAVKSVPGLLPLVVVGGRGWKSGSVLRDMGRLEARGRIRYLGSVTDEQLVALYSAARLMVYPSLYEGFGLPLLEAMACGCPVLCSWSSSLPEVGGSAVRYFRAHDAGDLAAALARITADDAQLSLMKREGYSRATRFSFGVAARQVLDLLCQRDPSTASS